MTGDTTTGDYYYWKPSRHRARSWVVYFSIGSCFRPRRWRRTRQKRRRSRDETVVVIPRGSPSGRRRRDARRVLVVLAGSRDMPPPKRGRFNRRTHTVYQSREPHFRCAVAVLRESFAAEVRVELVDAARDSVVGSHRFGVLDLLQEQADQKALDYLKQAQSVIRANLPPGTQIPYLTQSESAKQVRKPPSSYYFEDPANSYLRDKSNLPTAVVHWPSAHFTVFGDKLWWAPTPISVETTAATGAI